MEDKKKDIMNEMTIVEAVQAHPEIMDVLVKYGFHCIGCHAAQFENIEQGAVVHGIDAKELRKDIEKAIEETGTKEKEDKTQEENKEVKKEDTEGETNE